MAEIAVNLVVDKLIPLLKSEAKLLRGVRGQIESISNDLRLMRAYLRDVDAKAEMEAENSDQSRKEWVAQIRQVSIHIQDVIDLYLYKVANNDEDDHHNPRRGRRNAVAGVLCKICDLLKSCVPRHEIASEIGEIRESINRLEKARQLYRDSNAAAESSGGRSSSPQRHYLRLRANFAEEEELVGIEHAKKELNKWLSEGAAGRKVMAVVGEGGLGKTTLVRNVYKQEQRKHSFDCYGWVDVSRSLKGVQLFKTLLLSFDDNMKERNVDKNLNALIEDIGEYLKEKKYLIVLDDVWETELWGVVELALPKNNGMIMITTRDTVVADSCKVSAKVHTYPLKPLDPENALRLFHSKAFQFGSENPSEELMKLSEEFTKKCDGVPLAIVAIASLLSTKKERVSEWKAVYNSLQSKLASDSHLKGYHQALSESYQDLSYHLKSCLLYFGLFPEQYAIKRARLINLWIAEGFVECREHQTQREVGEEYLAELIARSLVKVADVRSHSGRVRKCRVHDLMHDFIVKKCEELNFCQVKKGKPFCFDKWTRRLSIGTNVEFADLRTSADRNQCSLLRSFLLYNSEEEMISTFVNSLFSNFKLLVTLDVENIRLGHLPETIGNFVHLKYLNLRNTNIETIPKSIGKLRNLETLDLTWTNVSDLPVEIYSLTKLCYLNVCSKERDPVKLKRGVANLTALQKLGRVDVSDVVGELKNLKQLRSLKIENVVGKDGMWLCNAIESMSNLCSLAIYAKDNEILELESLTSPPPHLERLYLARGHSKMVPDWVFRLKNLIVLELVGFKLTQDQLCLVGSHLPELMRLYVDLFEGDEFNIQKGWFGKLQSLILDGATIKAIRIDEGSLPCLQHFYLWAPKLKAIRIDEGSLPCLQEFIFQFWPRNLEAVQVPDHVRKVLYRR